MKNPKILRSVFLLMILGALSFAFVSPKDGGIKPVKPPKSKTGKKKLEDTYYFQFTCSDGNVYNVKGFGSAESGSIETYDGGCVGGTYYATGTVSGTYTVSLGVANVDVTSVKATGAPGLADSYDGAPSHWSGTGDYYLPCQN